jgi:hypothetical protein
MHAKSAGNIDAAIEMLPDEIEGEIEQVNTSGSAAFQAGDYDRVDLARRQVEKWEITEVGKPYLQQQEPRG